jgi:hypothetical protein
VNRPKSGASRSAPTRLLLDIEGFETVSPVGAYSPSPQVTLRCPAQPVVKPCYSGNKDWIRCAAMMSPVALSFPVMNAVMPLRVPLQIASQSSSARVSVTVGLS